MGKKKLCAWTPKKEKPAEELIYRVGLGELSWDIKGTSHFISDQGWLVIHKKDPDTFKTSAMFKEWDNFVIEENPSMV